jgi:UDP-3-O-[3-hydroxymyristoyl] glucosamine N-acyltransferase
VYLAASQVCVEQAVQGKPFLLRLEKHQLTWETTHMAVLTKRRMYSRLLDMWDDTFPRIITVEIEGKKRIFKNHINSDGSIGGLVENTAVVSPAASISRQALILGPVVVEEGAKIMGQVIIDGDFEIEPGIRKKVDNFIDGKLHIRAQSSPQDYHLFLIIG